MKKSQIQTLSALAAAVVVLSALLIGLSWEPAEQTLPALVPYEAEDITAFSYQTVSVSLSFVKEEEGWSLADDPAFPVSTPAVEEMLTVLCGTVPQEQLVDADREAFGLTAPQCVIEATTTKGGATILIGSMNAVTDQLYVQVGEQVYLTDTSLLKPFSASLLELAQQYDIPKPDDHQSVQVQNSLGTVLLSCVGSQTGGEDGVWYVQLADGAWAPADETAAYNFYFLTWDMHWKSTAGYITDESQLAQYGLAEPQARYTLTYGGGTFDLIFGTSLPDNTTYAMCAGSPLVYTMDTLLVQWLTQAEANDVTANTESTSS